MYIKPGGNGAKTGHDLRLELYNDNLGLSNTDNGDTYSWSWLDCSTVNIKAPPIC